MRAADIEVGGLYRLDLPYNLTPARCKEIGLNPLAPLFTGRSWDFTVTSLTAQGRRTVASGWTIVHLPFPETVQLDEPQIRALGLSPVEDYWITGVVRGSDGRPAGHPELLDLTVPVRWLTLAEGPS